MGHTHGFGSTEEPLRRTVFGCRERGGPRLDHATGEGHVPFHKGDYHDALRHKILYFSEQRGALDTETFQQELGELRRWEDSS